MDINLTEREIAFLKQYANVFRKERDEDITADPIVVVEDVREYVAAEGYGDETVYVWENESFYSLDLLKQELLTEYSAEKVKSYCEALECEGICREINAQTYSVHIIYHPVAYFLTRIEAEKYVKKQSHNLKKPRVYTRYCGYANSGDLQCLSKLLLRMGQELNQGEEDDES